jgi:hypothetical protein
MNQRADSTCLTSPDREGDNDNYNVDFVLWMEKQALLLRCKRFDDLDLEHLTEELEAMAGKERRELRSRLTVLLVHLLKCRYQPERKTSSWLATLGEQRTQIALQLEDSPSLKLRIVDYVDKAYPSAVARAGLETGLDIGKFPATNPFTVDEIMSLQFVPEALPLQ